MELIVISNPSPIADEAQLINQLFAAGLKCFHLRKPESDVQMVRDLLSEIEPGFHDRIALHQFHEMAGDLDIKRLHYTEAARRTTPLKTLRNYAELGFTLSTSIHEVSALNGLDHFDYALYSPVFDSISKPSYKASIPQGFVWPKASHSTRVIALGGVQPANLKDIKQMGFDGAAVLGSLWKEPQHALERFNQLKEQLPA